MNEVNWLEQALVVFQGPSGGGKSTEAGKLVRLIKEAGRDAVVYSTDDYHWENNGYVFKPTRLGEFHAKNLERSKAALDARQTVIVDNTNIRRWECKGYVEHAVKLGIPVVFIRVDGNFQNIHGVPDDKVRMMRDNMEELTVESVLASQPPPYMVK